MFKLIGSLIILALSVAIVYNILGFVGAITYIIGLGFLCVSSIMEENDK